MQLNHVLLANVLLLLLAIDTSGKIRKSNTKSKSSMTINSKGLTVNSYKNGKMSSYTYSRTTPRDLNYGARYYMQYSTVTSTSTFGYSFYRSGSYYYSGYGYRMYYPPSYYAPVYVGSAYYYYPPMFFYYFRADSNYWSGNRPRYTCRNDNAFWPLENQTSEFVDGRVPSLDLSKFDLDLPDADSNPNPNPNPTPSPMSSIFGFGSSSSSTSFNSTSALSGDVTELNSLTLNADPFADFDYTTEYVDDAAAPTTRSWTTSFTSTSFSTAKQWNSAKKPILAYNYFVCPDGKDASETFCCGPSTAQYCCNEEEYQGETSSWTWVTAVTVCTIVLIVVVVIAVLFRKIRRHSRNHRTRTRQVNVVKVHGETVTMTTHTAEFVPVPAPTRDPREPVHASGAYAGPSPAAPAYPTSYQPVVGLPPSYTSVLKSESEPTDQAAPYSSATMTVPTYPPPVSPYSSTFAPYPTGPTGVPYQSLTSPAPYVPASVYTPVPSGGV